jgi:hypothetical protein
MFFSAVYGAFGLRPEEVGIDFGFVVTRTTFAVLATVIPSVAIALLVRERLLTGTPGYRALGDVYLVVLASFLGGLLSRGQWVTAVGVVGLVGAGATAGWLSTVRDPSRGSGRGRLKDQWIATWKSGTQALVDSWRAAHPWWWFAGVVLVLSSSAVWMGVSLEAPRWVIVLILVCLLAAAGLVVFLELTGKTLTPKWQHGLEVLHRASGRVAFALGSILFWVGVSALPFVLAFVSFEIGVSLATVALLGSICRCVQIYPPRFSRPLSAARLAVPVVLFLCSYLAVAIGVARGAVERVGLGEPVQVRSVIPPGPLLSIELARVETVVGTDHPLEGECVLRLGGSDGATYVVEIDGAERVWQVPTDSVSLRYVVNHGGDSLAACE